MCTWISIHCYYVVHLIAASQMLFKMCSRILLAFYCNIQSAILFHLFFLLFFAFDSIRYNMFQFWWQHNVPLFTMDYNKHWYPALVQWTTITVRFSFPIFRIFSRNFLNICVTHTHTQTQDRNVVSLFRWWWWCRAFGVFVCLSQDVHFCSK